MKKLRKKLMKNLMILLLAAILPFAVSPMANAADEDDGPAYSVKNGRVWAKGTEIDAEVNEAPEWLDNGIKYWAALEGGDDADETGVWFFTRDEGEGGTPIGFISLDSAYEYQDIVWSPDGGRLLLMTGSGMRPDVFFTLYGEGMEKKAEFSGLRGGAEWIDPNRFVLTRIDDLRADEEGVILQGAGYKTSVVLYDSPTGAETVLKESSDTGSFALGAVAEGKIVIGETYVASPKDWADEDKIEEREITVDIPPAK